MVTSSGSHPFALLIVVGKSLQERNLTIEAFFGCYVRLTVADPGFPRHGGTIPLGVPTYDFAEFPQKLHEIERIRTPGGGGGTFLAPSLDPPIA